MSLGGSGIGVGAKRLMPNGRDVSARMAAHSRMIWSRRHVGGANEAECASVRDGGNESRRRCVRTGHWRLEDRVLDSDPFEQSIRHGL